MILFDLNNIYIHIKIKYCKKISFKINYLDINQKIIFDCDFNSLNFDKFILFNTPLNFKLSSIIFLLNFFEFEKIEQSNKLGTKTHSKCKEIEKNIEFEFDNNNENISKDILFSLTYNEERSILTIHDLINDKPVINNYIDDKQFVKEKIYNNNLKIINNTIEDLNNIVKNLKQNPKLKKEYKKNFIEKINENFKDFEGYVDFEKYIFSLIDLKEEKFLEKHFNITLCYLYIVMFQNIKRKLKNIMLKCNFEEIDIKFIYSILKKYSQFKEYEDIINNKNNNNNSIKNLIIKNNNLSFKKKMNILSSISTIIFQSPIFKNNTYIEFYHIEENKNNIYFKIKQFVFDIIDRCNKESKFIEGIEMLFSRILTDLNKCNQTYLHRVFINQIKNLEQLKNEIKSFFPSMICRYINSNDNCNAFYDILSDIIGINERIYIKNDYKMIYGEYDDLAIKENINNIIEGKFPKEDKEKQKLYNLYFFKGFWRIIHESYGHQPIQKVNDYKVDTPRQFYDNSSIIEKKDAGNILEYFVNKNSSLITLIKEMNCDVSELINVNLYTENFNKFWIIAKKLFNNLECEEDSFQPKDYEKVKDIYNNYYKDDNCFVNQDKYKNLNPSSLSPKIIFRPRVKY